MNRLPRSFAAKVASTNVRGDLLDISGGEVVTEAGRRPDALISALIGFAIGKIAGTARPRFGRLARNFPLGSYRRQ